MVGACVNPATKSGTWSWAHAGTTGNPLSPPIPKALSHLIQNALGLGIHSRPDHSYGVQSSELDWDESQAREYGGDHKDLWAARGPRILERQGQQTLSRFVPRVKIAKHSYVLSPGDLLTRSVLRLRAIYKQSGSERQSASWSTLLDERLQVGDRPRYLVTKLVEARER